MIDQTLTIVKVISKKDLAVDAASLKRWQEIFVNHLLSPEAAAQTGETFFERTPLPETKGQLLLVKVGDEGMKPTLQDLEYWRNALENLKNNPTQILVCPDYIDISVVDIGRLVAVEFGNDDEV